MPLYPPNEYCLDFEKSEIEEYLINPLKAKYPDLIFPVLEKQTAEDIDKLMSLHEPEENRLSKEQLLNIFKDDKEKYISLMQRDILNIHFRRGNQLDICYKNDIDFIFCDEKVKKDIDFNETYGNVVYQGNLRDKTHKEILTLVKDFVELLLDAEELRIEETEVSGEIDHVKRIYKIPMFPEWEAGHAYCYYNVYLKKQKPASPIQFDNIIFHTVTSLKK